jgi:hypothetical protein
MPIPADSRIKVNKLTPESIILYAVFLAGLLLIPMLTTSPAHAASTSVRVTARVLPWLNVSAIPHVSSYRVDAEDIQRGFVDLPNSLSIQLATNLRSDIDLSLSSFGPERVLVGSANSGSDIIRIEAQASNLPVLHEVDLCVILPSDIEQGNYPLQLNISASHI